MQQFSNSIPHFTDPCQFIKTRYRQPPIKHIQIIQMYTSHYQPPLLHQWAISDASQLPLPDEKRKLTDVICIVLGVLFGVILFIVAIVLFNSGHLSRTDYPADAAGNVCLLDAMGGSKSYPFLYFEDIESPDRRRFCVEDCPEIGVKTNCFGNCSVSYYPNYPTSSDFGPLCLPEDETAKNRLLYNAGLYNQYNQVKAINYLLIGVAISSGLSLFWLLLVQFLPKYAVWVAVILASVLLLITAIIFFTNSNDHLVDESGWALTLGIVCILILALIVFYAVCHRKQLEICAKFLEIAGESLSTHWKTFLFIPIFIIVTFIFGILLVFEYLAFSSKDEPQLTSSSIFYQTSKNGFLTFLLVIQAIWGLSFFRDAFNYVISGHAADWYFSKPYIWHYPLYRLTKNLGSVAGGAFLSGLFYIPSLLISFLAPDVDCCFYNLFDLTRSDTYAYIYLTGNSFCPSSRQAQYLCYRSRICRQNESAAAIYAFAARIVMALSAVLIIFWITKDNLIEERVPGYLLLGIFFMCLYVTCFFVDIHSATAEALLLCFLTEYDLEEGWTCKKMRFCPEKLKLMINDIDVDPTELNRSFK